MEMRLHDDSVRPSLSATEVGVSVHRGPGYDVCVRLHADTPESARSTQPLWSQDNTIVWEGHVDNRADVARALRDPSLALESDGAVLLAAYCAWGESLSARVVGEYAYAIVDQRQQRVVAAHDSLGIRRIRYRVGGDRVWLSSNLALLFSYFPDSRVSIDADVLPEYFAGPMVPWSGRTLWRGVRELGRGRALVVSRGEANEHTVWTPSIDERVGRWKLDDVADALRTHVTEAVGHAMRSNGPVLCDLSGGLDSAAVSAAATHIARSGRHALPLTWSTATLGSNDGALQGLLRDHLGLEGVSLQSDRHLPFSALAATDLPCSSVVQCEAADHAMRLECRARGITTRLTGHGADVLLQKGQPAPLYLAEWLRMGRWRDWRRGFASYLRSGHFNAWQLLAECTVGSLDPHAGRVRHPLPGWLTPRFRALVVEAQHAFVTRPRMFDSHARDRDFNMMLHLIPYHGQMLPDERLPLAHRPLVEFLLSVDWAQLTAPGCDRPLLRRAMQGWVPDRVFAEAANSRHSASVLEGLRQSWSTVARHLSGEQLASLGAIDMKRWQSTTTAIRGGYLGVNPQCTNTALYLEPWLSLQAGVATD